MNNVYVSSEKLWRSPQFKVESLSLGEVIFKYLDQADPEKVFEVLHDTGTNVTTKEIRQKTITVAQNLLKLGVKKDDRVVFFTMLNLKITPLTFACYTIGAPVCFFETYLSQEHVPTYLEMLDPTVILYEEQFKSMVFKGLKGLNLSNLKLTFTLDGNQNSVDQFLFEPPVDIENFLMPNIGYPDVQPAILGFTSATTGLPKIIINSHSIVRRSAHNQWNVQPSDVIMILSEIRWSCQIGAMLQPALRGVKRIYSSTPPIKLTGEFIVNIINAHKVTHYFEVPRVLRPAFETAERSKNPTVLSSLKFVSFGGERVGEAFRAYLSKIAPNCKFEQCYGMTEVAGEVANTEFASRKNVNGGVLRNGFIIKIIDKNKNSLGHNQLGRVWVKAPAPFLGYLKNDKANKETFIDGWMDTGDLGVMHSDNLLDIFTREKYTLKYADSKLLLPTDVEGIIDNLEGVYLCALVGNPSSADPKNDCGTIFVVPEENIDLNDLQNRLRQYLRHNLTPEQLKVVRYFKILDDLPNTSCFKIDRFALRRMTDGALKI